MRRWLGLFLVVVAVSACGDDGGSPNTDAACLDGNGEPIGDDCDDSDADRFPGNEEVCDDHDPTAIGYLDADGVISNQCCNPVSGGSTHCGGDCDDQNRARNSAQVEFCDNADNDCDDGEITIHPAQAEACDGIDNSCNGQVDERLLNCATTPVEPPPPVINECLNRLDNCTGAQTCLDLPMGFSCSGTDPCATNNGGCSPTQTMCVTAVWWHRQNHLESRLDRDTAYCHSGKCRLGAYVVSASAARSARRSHDHSENRCSDSSPRGPQGHLPAHEVPLRGGRVRPLLVR